MTYVRPIKRIALAGLIPTAYQTITLSNSTAVGLNSTVRTAGAQVIWFSVETNDVRFRCDSTAPTLTTGVLLQSDDDYMFNGVSGTVTNWKFQRSTGTAKICLQAFKYDG